MSVTAPNLCLVPVDTIYEPIVAIPDEGAHFLIAFVLVRSRDAKDTLLSRSGPPATSFVCFLT